MGRYSNIIIKANISSEANYNEKYQYAETCMPAFKQYREESDPTHECSFSLEGDTNYSYIYINGIDSEICHIELQDGYWAFDLCYNDYMFTNTEVGGKNSMRIIAKKLCDLLNQHEAWICVEDHATNSDTAPEKFEDWVRYAELVGIQELNNELLQILEENEEKGFYSRTINYRGKEYDCSFPIYHDTFIDL